MRVVVVSHQKYPSHGGWKRKKKCKKKKKKRKCMLPLWELRRTKQGLVLFY